MSALYSIETGDSTQANYKKGYGDNAEASAIIRSVMMEEMLHFTLMGNILNAVAGKFKINTQEYVPIYPTRVPHSNGHLLVSLRKFSKEAISTFCKSNNPHLLIRHLSLMIMQRLVNFIVA